ncbi:MAG TPA: hypothetical protein VJ697_06910 [Nitrososphaeraceae archaeon]|nr:hypothetical protein [Nitrososphaeraceae archaeon]
MNLNLAIVVAVALFTFVSYSCQFSFAKTNNEKEEDDKKNIKNIVNLPINKNETRNYDLKELSIQNNNTSTLNDKYPDQYYICGYPKQLIPNYSFLEKLNCD